MKEEIFKKLGLPGSTKLPYLHYVSDNITLNIYKYRGEIRLKVRESSSGLEFIIKDPESHVIELLKYPWEYQKYVLRDFLRCVDEFDSLVHPVLVSLGFIRVPGLREFDYSVVYKRHLFPEGSTF